VSESRPPLVLVTSIPRSVRTAIGVDMDNATINQRLGELVTGAGGLPVASDAWSDPEVLADRVDAIVLNGGGDVAPERYGAERLPRTDPADERRDTFELGLVRAALDRGLPMLGICRGMQLLNVALGGTLVQDLAPVTSLEHEVADPWDRPVHDIEVEPGSLLARAVGASRARVNSAHHQAVDRLGDGLRVTARAPDGVIEAFEDERGLLFGVQWHPEFMAPGCAAEQEALFAAFLELVLAPERSQPGEMLL
jgi:putative glutamine amidotransferase